MIASAESVAAAFERAKPALNADYGVVPEPMEIGGAYLAMSRRGCPAFLVPVTSVTGDSTRLTHGLALRSASMLEFERGSQRWTEPAAVIECRDTNLLQTFSGMVAAMAARLQRVGTTWQAVAELFAEWERLLGRQQLLSGESELGLWGELWWIAHSTRATALVEGWRGPEREHVDFLVDGTGFEVKTSRRANVHLVSQKQVAVPLGDVPIIFLSMFAMIDPLRGVSLAELVREVGRTTSSVAAFEEGLASVGYARHDESAYGRKYALMEAPKFYPREVIPRVRLADPGVSDLRYRVQLEPVNAMSGPTLTEVTTTLGLDPSRYDYPCG